MVWSTCRATQPVQNAGQGAAGRLAGVQSIPKAELIGAVMQLRAAAPCLEDGESEFHGFLDNQGIVTNLKQAKLMTDRTIKRGIAGSMYHGRCGG